MDPLSIVAATATLTSLCGKVLFQLAEFNDKASTIDETVVRIKAEVSALSTILGSIEAALDQCIPTSNGNNVDLASLTGHEGQHWKAVQRLLGDCESSLKRMTMVLQGIQDKDRSILRKTREQFKLDLKAAEITSLRCQIQSYTDALQLSLHLVGLSSQASSRVHLLSLAPRLDDLTVQVLKVQSMMRKRSAEDAVNWDKKTTAVFGNIRACIRTAGTVISSASTVLDDELANDDGHKSSEGGSFRDDDLDESGVHEWLEDLSVENDKEPEEVGDAPDIEGEIIKQMRKDANDKVEQKEFASAVEFIDSVQARSVARYGEIYPCRADLLRLLVICHRKLFQWDKAIACQMVLRQLPSSHAEAITRDYRLAKLHLKRDIAKGIRSLNSPSMPLAQATLDKTRQKYGNQHPLYYESLGLLTRVLRWCGNTKDADTCQSLIPTAMLEAPNPPESTWLYDKQRPHAKSPRSKPAVNLGAESSWPQPTAYQLKSLGVIMDSENGFTDTMIQKLTGSEALELAISKGFIGLLTIVYESGTLNPNEEFSSYKLVLIEAAARGNLPLVERLVRRYGADVNARSSYYSALYWAVGYSPQDNMQMMKFLIANGADVSRELGDGFFRSSALSVAVENSDVDAVEFLLKCGVTFDVEYGRDLLRTAKNRKKSTPKVDHHTP